MKTLILITLLIVSQLAPVFSQNGPCPDAISGPAHPSDAAGLALNDLTWQVLNLEMEASRLEQIYFRQTSIEEALAFDLADFLDTDALVGREVSGIQGPVLDDLEEIYLFLLDQEVELNALAEEVKLLNPFDQLYTAENPLVDPASIAERLSLDLWERLAGTCGGGDAELEALFRHLIGLEWKVLVLRETVRFRQGYAGAAPQM